MSTKIFVGGLPWATDDHELRSSFAEYGEILEAKVIYDRDTGRSRGFGFVTFADEKSAEGALTMDGQPLGGRTIRVDLAQERTRGGGGGGGGGGGRGDGGGGYGGGGGQDGGGGRW